MGVLPGIWSLGGNVQISMLPALTAVAHNKVSGCTDDGYGGNTADRHSYRQIGREGLRLTTWKKNIIVMFSLSSDKTLSNGYYFVVDEHTAIKLVSITRWKGNEYPLYITVTVNYTFSSPERPNRLGRRGLDAKLDIWFLLL